VSSRASLALGACERAREENEAPASQAAEAQAARPEPETLLVVEPEDVAGMDLGFAQLEKTTWSPSRTTYGRVVDDPTRRCELRAPLAGVLSAGDVVPSLGAELEAGAIVFRLAPRWTQVELADLEARRVATHADLAAAEAEAPALSAELERARLLNAQEKSVSDKELQDAEARVQANAARVRGARELLVQRTLGDAAAEIAQEPEGTPLQDVARRIGVSYGTLRNWVSEFRRQCDRGMRPPFSPRRRADGRRAAAAANARRSTRPTSACCP